MLANILLYAGLFVGGLIAGLKVVAPLTKNKVDDKILYYGEEAVELLEKLGVKVPGHVEVAAVAASPKS